FTTDSLTIELSFFSPSIVRIVKSPIGKPLSKESLVVIKSPQKTTFRTKQTGNILNVTTEKITASVDLKSGTIMYKTGGTVLLKEKETAAGFIPFNDAGSNTFSV